MHALALAAILATTAPKNIILLIGDGLGPAHVTAIRQYRGPGFDIGKMPVIGMATTWCSDRAVTDSAAAATAIATGVKTNYEWVSVTPDGKPLPTVLDRAEERGKATGIVTTAMYFDATPAAFAAEAHRENLGALAMEMLHSGVEVIAGAGLRALTRVEMPPVLEEAQRAGYSVVSSRSEIDAVKGAGPVLAVFAEQTRDLDQPDAPLCELTEWALGRLRGDRDGFFLMVEHEGIDSSSHQNNNEDAARALRSFDMAVGVALDFARRGGDTLVIVTGDHETGGLRISETKMARFRMEWSTTDHTGVAVPVFAFGPGAERFAGWYDNTELGKKMMELVR